MEDINQDHVEVEVTFLPTNAGGRSTPVFSGYRCQFFYDGEDRDVEQKYINKEIVYPGETVKALIRFYFPENVVGKLKSGKVFLLREGFKVIGYGQITKIFKN